MACLHMIGYALLLSLWSLASANSLQSAPAASGLIKSDIIAEVLEVVKLVDGNSNAQQPLHFLWPSASERRNPLPFLKQTLVRTRCKKK